jgi:hypothetical protein
MDHRVASQQHHTRRRVIAGLASLAGLSACGENRTGRTVVDAFRLAIIGQPDAPISRQTVANLPYASIAAKIGKGPRSLLILWQASNDELLWLSADNAAIVTRHGRVVRTAGLPENIRSTQSDRSDPLELGLHKQASAHYSRIVDFGRDHAVNVSQIDSLLERVGPRDIVIEEIAFKTVVYHEQCEDRSRNWNFQNKYWLDPVDGFVWKSRQHIARSFPAIEIEVLKPAG